ncbi:MAG: tyrosine-type recombinase/integrase [Helicobacteraceae bacterium]|jgi:integrase|nr:tyrosine-type recombinase/integrase [Helicobacteraceae bacterium]
MLKIEIWIRVRKEDDKTSSGGANEESHTLKQPTIALDLIVKRYFEATKRRVSASKMLARYEAHIKPILGDREASAVTRADLIALYNVKLKENAKVGRHLAALKRLKTAAKEIKNGEALALRRKIAKKKLLIAALRESENGGYSKAFCRSLLDIIGAAYAFEMAQETPLIYKNPIAGLYKTYPEIAKLGNEKERTFTKSETARILEATKALDFARRFALLAVATGARRGALLRLRRKDVDLESNAIRLIDEKAESGDTSKDDTYIIPLCSYARRELESFLGTLEPNDLVVWGSRKSRQGDGAPNAQMINYYLQPMIDGVVEGNREAKGNARLSLHTFRSFAITAMLDGGCPEFLARRFSNHSTGRRSSFNRYAKANVEQLRPHLERAMEFLEEGNKRGLTRNNAKSRRADRR